MLHWILVHLQQEPSTHCLSICFFPSPLCSLKSLVGVILSSTAYSSCNYQCHLTCFQSWWHCSLFSSTILQSTVKMLCHHHPHLAIQSLVIQVNMRRTMWMSKHLSLSRVITWGRANLPELSASLTLIHTVSEWILSRSLLALRHVHYCPVDRSREILDLSWG